MRRLCTISSKIVKCSKGYARYLILLFLQKDYLSLDINLLYSGNSIEFRKKEIYSSKRDEKDCYMIFFCSCFVYNIDF